MKKPIIQFENFSFKYKSQAQPTLIDMNLTIYEGEKVLIVGPSGSGKSTIAHCINGLVPFFYKGEMTGSLRIMGKETLNEGIFALSKMVGTVLQDPDGQFLGLTVGEDMAFSLENDCIGQEEMKLRVAEAAKLAGLPDHLDHSVHQLSGGQKQRAALGGVMVNEVKILLFDEPLANLDPATGVHAIQLIDQIRKETNTTVIMIEHRLEDVLECDIDRIIVVNYGRVICDLAPDEIFSLSVLGENGLREPLYLKALKFAGCSITPEMNPNHIDRLVLNGCKKKLIEWLECPVPSEKEEKNSPILEVEQVYFQYDNQREILQDISFSILKGEMVSIVGKNGAGKSTLANLICGFEKPNIGKIQIAGRDVTNDTIKERASKIGMILQNPNQMISKAMIYEEVALGLIIRGVPEEELKRRIEKTLKICGLYPYRNWPISALSFGQKKRVTIASILVLEPEILILDEPTAGQDYRHYTEILEFLRELNSLGTTILMITHDMHLMLEYTPRAIVIADGKIIADGQSPQALSDKNVIEQANLKQTSLYKLAIRAGIDNPNDFVQHFIRFDKEIKRNGR